MKTFIFLVIFAFETKITEPTITCRPGDVKCMKKYKEYRSTEYRQDGGLCFELPPWQYQPVTLDNHVDVVRDRWGNSTRRMFSNSHLALSNNEITRYLDTVLGPFLDTYHRNIQNSYQQLTGKILRRIKDEINAAVQRKREIYDELTRLADSLNVPEMCDEERRLSKTVASRHVAQIFSCTEAARTSIAQMGKYAEEMIGITKNHMQATLEDTARSFQVGLTQRTLSQVDVSTVINQLSKAAVVLGYELDLSLTNARRYNEQSSEKLNTCCNRVRKSTEETVDNVKEFLYQCVYA